MRTRDTQDEPKDKMPLNQGRVPASLKNTQWRGIVVGTAVCFTQQLLSLFFISHLFSQSRAINSPLPTFIATGFFGAEFQHPRAKPKSG